MSTYKLVSPGINTELHARTFFEINLSDDGRLFIAGVVGPDRSGGCRGSCGQIQGHLGPIRFDEGWNDDILAEFRQVWDRWHLNDMQAGTPEQTDALKPFYAERTYPENTYSHACEYLKGLGLYEVPDTRPGREGQMYRYGTAWLTVAVPQHVIDWLMALPTSTVPLPGIWGRGKVSA